MGVIRHCRRCSERNGLFVNCVFVFRVTLRKVSGRIKPDSGFVWNPATIQKTCAAPTRDAIPDNFCFVSRPNTHKLSILTNPGTHMPAFDLVSADV